jgi:nicotinamide riboside kinase
LKLRTFAETKKYGKKMKIIVVSGPESVGKTTLCLALKERLGAVYLPEYARNYIENLNRTYTYRDVNYIAKLQISELQKAISNNHNKEFIVMDTFLIVTKVWFMHVFKQCPKWLQPALETTKIDLFLLLKPNIEWQQDNVRENPHIRQYLYEWYKRELTSINANFVEIGGLGETRTTEAIEAIVKLKN